jgi:hypothetical protein
VAALSLGLSVGATSVIYALIDQLLVHDVTAPEPDRLVTFNHGPWSSYPNFRGIRDNGVFAQLAADTGCFPHTRWREGDRTHAIVARCVSRNFFETATASVYFPSRRAARVDPLASLRHE